MRLPDELCLYCRHKSFTHKGQKIHCSGDCLLLDIVGKNIPLREKLLLGLRTDEDRDYKVVLNEYASDHEARTELLPQIKDKRKRAIAAMLLAGLHKTDIAGLLSMSIKQIGRISSNNNNIYDE